MSLHTFIQPSLAHVEARSRGPVQVSHIDGKDPTPRAISRELAPQWSVQDLNQHSAMGCCPCNKQVNPLNHKTGPVDF